MGGKWPLRLTQVCLELLGQFEDSELELYTAWREAHHHDLTILLCSNTNRQNSSTSFFYCFIVDRTGLGECLGVAEQGDLVREEIEDMLRVVGGGEQQQQLGEQMDSGDTHKQDTPDTDDKADSPKEKYSDRRRIDL